MNHELSEKKLSSYQQMQTASWGIDVKKVGLPLSEIVKHKEIAMHYMLPGVSEKSLKFFFSRLMKLQIVNTFLGIST